MGRLVRRGASRRRKPELFLSHRSVDKPFVRTLAEDLAFVGVDSWLDVWEIEVGDELHEAVGNALDKAAFVAVVIGSAGWDSPWVKREMNAALSREVAKGAQKKIVLPIVIGDGTPPAFLRDRLYLDFRHDYFQNLVRLCGAVRGLRPKDVSTAIDQYRPTTIGSAMQTLDSIGFGSRILLDKDEFSYLAGVGRTEVVNRRREVWFDPDAVLRRADVSSELRKRMRRYDDD